MRKLVSLGLISSFILIQASVASTPVVAEEDNAPKVESKSGGASTKGNVGFKGSLDPDIPVNPGEGLEEELIDTDDEATKGPYSISYISNLNFGSHYYEKDKANTFFAKNDAVKLKNGKTMKKPNFVQISDASASKSGWKLYVSLEGPLSNENEAKIDEMTLSLNNLIVKPVMSDQNPSQNPADIEISKTGVKLTGKDTAPKLVAEAKGMQGQGRWHVMFGKTIENGQQSVSLHFPKGAITEPGKYQTNLVWTFGDVK